MALGRFLEQPPSTYRKAGGDFLPRHGGVKQGTMALICKRVGLD